MSDVKTYDCPHCGGKIEILELNCGIFRHAVLKVCGTPINPHASQTECQSLINSAAILGCAGPIRWNGTGFEKCDYI